MRTLLVAALALAAAPLAAQAPPPPPPAGTEVVDRVVAVVGDTVLLLSDVRAELQQLEAAGRTLPTDPVQRDQVGREIVESRVNDLILLEAAQEAGLQVAPEEINEQVEQEIRSVRTRFQDNDAAFQAALARSGITLEQYRQQVYSQWHSRRMIESFIQQRLRNRARPLVGEEEIREMFEAQKGSLGTRPTTVSLQQVVVAPHPTDSAKAAARREAEDVHRQLFEGGDFEVLARRFSDDPGSKEHGGDLGWFRAGRMVPEFEAVAFALRPGETSGIVETDFGFHIIKVEKVRGGERQARHILITPEVTEADRLRARERADSVAAAIRAGANPLELARRYDTPAAEVEVSRIPVDRLPPGYAEPLRGAVRGDVVGPVELESPAGSSWAVLKVVDRTEAGEYTLEDVRDQIRTRLEQAEMIEQLVAELRREIYVSIRS